MLKEHIPNSMMYITLVTIEDIIGKNGLNSLLNHANLKKYRENYPPNNEKNEVPIVEFSSILGSLIEIFGERGARPILYNAGRRGFQVVLEKNPAMFGLVGLGLKVLSKRKRLEKIFTIGAEGTNKVFGENQRFYISDEGFVCELFDCYWCKGIKSEGCVCFGEVGLDAEVAKWATGDEHEVKEVLCRARGDDVCKFIISFEPKKES
jgi:predicted hydrocarbon binding protein